MSSAWIRGLSGRRPAAAAATSGWLTLRRGGWTWHLAAELQDAIGPRLMHAASDLGQSVKRSPPHPSPLPRSGGEGTGGEILKQTANRTVERWTVDDCEYYAKTFRATGFAERLRELLRGPQARWEAGRIALALAHGVPTATVVAVGWNDDRLRSPDSVLVTRGVPDVLPLSRLRARYEVPGEAVSITDRHGLIDAVADLLATLHGRGLVHGDLHAGNVVVRRDADGWRAWLIDLSALRRPMGGVRPAAAFENLARIDYSLLFTANDAERRRFFRRYCSQRVSLNVSLIAMTRRQALARHERSRQRFIDRVGPQVDAAWSRGHRKVIDIPGGMGLASLGREWLTKLAGTIEDVWQSAKSQALAGNHRGWRAETPLGVRTLRVIRFPAASTATARATWDATHAALRRGVAAVVPWLCVETADAGYLVCCQPDDAVPLAGTDLLTTPDGRWTGLAAVEQLAPSTPKANPLRRRVAAVWLAVALMMLSGCGWLNRKPT
ncbi:MAG TPA: lipopolysaccharide kinase InaA family protein, partial [Planctomycetaceae bacterium]|nr:lipopolysaccharide kinase InaA family protein [Planctomycetaceae bacterium]